MTDFSILSGYKKLTSTRIKPWDDPELDILEGFKAISFVILIIIATSFYLLQASTINTWKILDCFDEVIYSFVMNGNFALEAFIVISGFLGAYRGL